MRVNVLILLWNQFLFGPSKVRTTIYKSTPVQALRLCTGRTAHSGSRGIALPFLDHRTRRGWGVSVTPRPLFTPGKEPVQEAGWAPGPVWTGAENLAPTGIRSQDRPARSQSLYQLNYNLCYLQLLLLLTIWYFYTGIGNLNDYRLNTIATTVNLQWPYKE